MTALPQSGKTMPELSVSQWFNTTNDLSLGSLRGRPILIHAFQMLCPACVSHGVPQTQKAHEVFSQTDLAVIGLHTVFEHHDAMAPASLKAFIHEYRLAFPIGVDRPGAKAGLPQTMARYGLRGTPTTIVVDRAGRLVMHTFGMVNDMALGSILHSVLVADTGSEAGTAIRDGIRPSAAPDPGCDDTGCDDTGCFVQPAEHS